GALEVLQLKPPPPVLTSDTGPHPVIEFLNTTGSPTLNTAPSASLSFTDFDLNFGTVSASLDSITWSAGASPPSGLAGVLAGALSIEVNSTSFNAGSITATF